MVVTEFGIVKEVRLEQPLNTLAPMPMTEFGRVTDVRLEHPKNAYIPILVTEFGMIIDVIFENLENAYPGIKVMPSGIAISFKGSPFKVSVLSSEVPLNVRLNNPEIESHLLMS